MSRRKTKRLVSVVRPDIRDGVQNDPSRCTVQLAVVRSFPDAESVVISNGLVRVNFPDEEWIYALPRSAVCIPVMIDEGLRDKVEPLDFWIRDPHIIPKRKRIRTPSPARKRVYNLEGVDETPTGGNAGVAASSQQRSSTARMRASLRDHFKAKPGQTRFQGIEI